MNGVDRLKRMNKWFLREPSATSKARLFCLPYSGCGASMYRQWPYFIGDIEVCPVQLPGRENRYIEESYSSYEELAEQVIPNLLPYLDRPFAFFGHCGSALPCYEIALQLIRNGQPMPSHLFISSQVAPHDGPQGRFLTMSDVELYEELKHLIIQMGGAPIPDLIELNLGVLRKDVDANKKYKPIDITKLNCQITAVGWNDDAEINPNDMKGWSECGDTDFVTLLGNHYSFLEGPEELFNLIKSKLVI
ncbi:MULTISPECIES: thioesterase II family protein [Bacillus]|nr:thioesterase domain-containing protein [Bacillus toyonensis]KXY48257.1 thioesterase [Bacillus cereus]MED3481490.1 thioesterase domain-containing protein [Bacillus toyonensis]HDR7891115.1 thioesterase [Bacillus toyonensis]